MSPFHTGALETPKDVLPKSRHYVIISATDDDGYTFLSSWFHFLKYFALWAKFFCFLTNGNENKVPVKIIDFWQERKCHNYKWNFRLAPRHTLNMKVRLISEWIFCALVSNWFLGDSLSSFCVPSNEFFFFCFVLRFETILKYLQKTSNRDESITKKKFWCWDKFQSKPKRKTLVFLAFLCVMADI